MDRRLEEVATLGRRHLPESRFGDGPCYMDVYTARIAASEHHLWLRSEEPPEGHSDYRPPTRVIRLAKAATEGATIALVMLAARICSDLLIRIRDLSPSFDEMVVVLEDAEGASRHFSGRQATTIVERSIGGDFAAQRNAAQAAVSADWAFHLDTDEWPDHTLLTTMRALAGLAGQDGIEAIGFPRRNLVDGRMSRLFPDTQYRLMRRHVRFRGKVHERPEVCDDWPKTTIALTGALDHFLSADRIETRHRAYEDLGQNSDRKADLIALRAPFWPAV